MRMLTGIGVAVMLWLGLISVVQVLAAVEYPSEVIMDHSFDRLRHFTLRDGVPSERAFTDDEHTEMLERAPFEIQECNDPRFEYMAALPYYKVFFKGASVRMNVKDGWIAFALPEQELGEVQNGEPVVEENSLYVSGVFESVDVSYTVESRLLSEIITLREAKQVSRIQLGISWGGITPEFQEDGSILFSDENEKILKILPPFMKDATGQMCTDVHYELVACETGYELHKVIDEEGLKWLQQAVYPVILDPSVQTFEDAWESSGLTSYGQYFKNLEEHVGILNGHLIIKQTDLVIPGRGLDLVISRVYETPAIFYQAEPYDYTAPPVNVGKGWQLDLPYIGEKYLHLWGGTVYKIEWVNDTFENHEGSHFILVKNGDSTYTLTMANGIVCEFSTGGTITQIRDLDQNTITFNYNSGKLASITDTIGRTVTFSYSSGYLSKITYNNAEIEYGISSYGNLVWMNDFLNRRTSYSYDSGWVEWFDYGSGYSQKENLYLLSEIVYPAGGYTAYGYDRFSYNDLYGGSSCLDYYKYFVTNQKVYETTQVRHSVYSFSGNFDAISDCVITVKNESDITQGFYDYNLDVNNGLITQLAIENSSGTKIRKYKYTYSSKKEITQKEVYNDGTTLSYTNYYAYDNWGNLIYSKNAEGHEKFFSYANTDTSGFFMNNTGTVIEKFTNAFSNSAIPASVHTVLLGTAEKQDATYVKEAYLTYDSEAHPTQTKNSFGTATTWLTYSGTFNEKTDTTSFPIDLTGHTVVGNAILQVTGETSGDTYQESHSYSCPCNPSIKCTWNSGSWSGSYYCVFWSYCTGFPPDCDDGWGSVGPFTHYPGTLGYQSYSTTPSMGGKSHIFTVKTYWKAYPVQVKYNLDNTSWETITSNLQNQTVQIPVTITDGSHTLYFSESSAKNTKFSWYLYVPVDNTPDTSTTTMTYDIYGNVTSFTDAESNIVSFTYPSTYSSAYLTEISATVGTDTITTKATYDYYRGWITSIQEPKGVASSGYDTLYTYDILGRILKKECPLLSGQSERSYLEAVYDDTNRTVTIIDQLRHYVVQQYDKLGRLTNVRLYTGTYGSGTLYATTSYAYRYDDKISSVTNPGNNTYISTYDFLGRYTQIQYPDSSSVFYSYDDTNNKITLTNGRSHHTVYWYTWLSQLEKVEEEYTTGTFAVTTYQYDEIGHLTSFTDAENNTTHYTYASLFGLTKAVYPDSEYEECGYDNAGNITSFTDANGNETVFTYDDVYRLIEIEYEDQSTVSFTYDLNSNRTKMEDCAPNTNDYVEYTYDKWDRLTTQERHSSTQTYAVSYQYDIANRLTKLTYPDNMQILYSYDDLNRTTEIKRYIDGSNDEILMDNVQYNVESLLTQLDYGNDLRATFTYDARDRLSTLDVNDGVASYLDLDYTYDCNNNITQVINGWRDTNSDWHSQTESYSYDGLDRLTSANCTSWSHTYSYDKVGNRTSIDSVTYTINTVNEVTALSDGTSFMYDSNGNRTQKTKGTDTWVYTYDYANRLTKVEKNSNTLGEYLYDGDGKRIQVTENSVTKTYIYSGLNVLYEETMTGTAVYMYGPTGRIAKRTAINGETTMFYFHTDYQGSTRLVTDETKNIVSAAAYQPFGELYSQEGSETYLFTGKEKDASGLYYYGARYYDPEIGRFLTRDPLTGRTHVPQSLNRYNYCLGNPLKYSDPAGLSAERIGPTEGGTNSFEQQLMREAPPDIFQCLYHLWRSGLISTPDRLWEFIWHCIEGTLEKMYTSILSGGSIDEFKIYLFELMSLLEAVVLCFGDLLGISGAFICIEGMGEALFFGAQGGVCLMFHPNTGWGMYTYKGSVRGFQIGGGISIAAGFFTWHGNPKDFTFDDWKGEFIGTDFSPAFFTVNKFHNEDFSITGWQVSIGPGIAIGVAGTYLTYNRASDWLIPLDLRGIVVPQGG